jgi:zinc/manganese transport system ATP-binding protein
VTTPGPDRVAIELKGAGVRLGGSYVWRDATLTIPAGEFVVVLGPNGSGKTTLLRLLLGLIPAAEGSVAVLGGPARAARSHIGYVPQRRTLDPDLTVRGCDLVSLGVDGARFGLPLPSRKRREQAKMVDEALTAVGAADYSHRPVGRLSGGEQQRLLLAQALVTRPRLLLLDEPLASLDLRSQNVITQLIATVARERGITVVLVAHDINPLVSVTDRVAYIAGGQVVSGTPEDVITSENLSSLYDYPVEVMRDTQGRIAVIGLGDPEAHHG